GWLFVRDARKGSVPLASPLHDPHRLDLPFEPAMPANREPANAADTQPPPVDLEPVAVLFEAESLPAIAALEARVAGVFTRFGTPEEGLKGFVQVVYHELQDVAVYVFGVRVGRFALFHPPQLCDLANRL